MSTKPEIASAEDAITRTFTSELIYARSFRTHATVGVQVTVTLVIGHDDDDIGVSLMQH